VGDRLIEWRDSMTYLAMRVAHAAGPARSPQVQGAAKLAPFVGEHMLGARRALFINYGDSALNPADGRDADE
jgi:hypothetical protein